MPGLLATIVVGTAQAGALLVAGSLTYDQVTDTGLMGNTQFLYVPGREGVNNNGTAVGYAANRVSGNYMGDRAVRWDATGTAAIELGNLGTDAHGITYVCASAVNDAGTAVGYADKFVVGSSMYRRAVRWQGAGTAATELGNLGTDFQGRTQCTAYAVNNAGTAVGFAIKHENWSAKGERAVRWDATGTAATELGNLGADDYGCTYAQAYAINNAGTAVGIAQKFDSGVDKGYCAVRWDATGTAATELGNLGADGYGHIHAWAYAINDAGTAVGYAQKFDSTVDKGYRAVRWDGSGIIATELGNLGLSITGTTFAEAIAVNGSGTAVGYAKKHVSGSYKGDRAVRWDASGTTATELGNLGLSATGTTFGIAIAVNGASTAVGYAVKYVGGTDMGNRAVIWLPDASVIDLNDLGVVPVPAEGTWTLTAAKALSSDGWVAGEGNFDPDGTGPLASYDRLWVTQVGLGGIWTSVAGGTWGRGPNWSTGTPAMQVGDATFNLNSTYTVALDRDELTKTISVNAGTVTIESNGYTLTTESGLNIANGATLKGASTIVSDIINAGTIAPGNSPGTLNITGNLTNTGTLDFEIASLLHYDQVNFTGAFTAGGTIEVKLLDGYTPMAGDIFDIMDFGSFVNNGYTFDWSHATLSAGLAWDTTTFAGTGNIGVIGVPEPSAFTLISVGVASLFAWCWRQRRRTR